MEGGGSSADVSGKEDDDESSSSTPGQQQQESIQSALDDFREKWHQELKDTAASSGNLKDRNSNNPALSKRRAESANESCEQRARALFLQGSDLERDGKVFEAMRLYRRAVQLVPDIESKIYDKINVPKQTESKQKQNADHGFEINSLADELLEARLDDDEDLENVDLVVRFQNMLAKSKTLFESPLDADKTLIKTSAHFSDLPMEVILYILRWVVSNELDLRSLERFSRVCRGFYVLARDSEIWRRACVRIWGVNVGHLAGSPFYDWREMYINRPRVLFHGCYISRTSYLRYGENSFQDQFYRPMQLVEYYRYFRFFAGGRVTMLTSAEEPQTCVGRLKPRWPIQNEILQGHYRLHNDEIVIAVQRNRSSTQAQRSNWKKEHGQQTFYLELKISGTGKRPFSQLHWSQYSMVQQHNNQEKTTIFELVPGKYPPLYFSRVRSYHQESNSLLK